MLQNTLRPSTILLGFSLKILEFLKKDCSVGHGWLPAPERALGSVRVGCTRVSGINLDEDNGVYQANSDSDLVMWGRAQHRKDGTYPQECER